MTDCVFCEILAGRAPASIVHRDERCTAFLDSRPVNPGHTLVVPNVHAPALADLDAETGAHMFRVAQRLAAALRSSGVRCEAVNLLLSDGQAAMQTVPHTHLHVVPRFAGDGFGFRFGPDYFKKPARAELDAVADKIRHVLVLPH